MPSTLYQSCFWEEAGQATSVIGVDVRQDDGVDACRLSFQCYHIPQQCHSIAPGIKENGLLPDLDQATKAPGGLKPWVIRVIVVSDGNRHGVFPLFLSRAMVHSVVGLSSSIEPLPSKAGTSKLVQPEYSTAPSAPSALTKAAAPAAAHLPR
jgi:hypothetical protein